jgi:hypothetical protein
MKDLRQFIKTAIRECLNENKLNEISDESYKLIEEKYSDSKLIISKNDSITYEKKEQRWKEGFKPEGLWYGIGTSWLDWVRIEMPEWEDEHVFKIDVDKSKMLIIDTLEDLYLFTDKYSGSDGLIYWKLVATEYDGIEISPYIREARDDERTWWYYPWDVASGCIWGEGVITNIEKIL